MQIKNIDKYFPFEILRRGYDYYKKGNVKEIEKNKNNISARVVGTDTYKVTLTFKEDELFNMECTCPYAEDNNCKHMAAVLYCLKTNSIPVKESNISINQGEITYLEKFKKALKKEYNKLFHNRSYLHSNELEDYSNLIRNFIKEGASYIDKNKLFAYEIFEFLTLEIDSVNIYDYYNEKRDLLTYMFERFQKLFVDREMFAKLLSFIENICTTDSDNFYFEHKKEILNLLYDHIKKDWQAKYTLTLLKELEKNKKLPYYLHDSIRIKIIFINFNFLDKERGLELAEQNLDLSTICEFLLKIYKDDQNKKIGLLKKMISANKKNSNQNYYERLISIYRKSDKRKYLELLDEYFIEHEKMEIYHTIKKNYSKNEWATLRRKYISKIKNRNIYREVCLEEEYYDELLELLQDDYIELIDRYLEPLIKNRPKEILNLYTKKLLQEIENSSCRQHYQKSLVHFNSLLKIPHGKKELEMIIEHIRNDCKNKKALQEEIDFYVETYLS